MKRLRRLTAISIILLSFSFGQNIMAQTDNTDILDNDSLLSDKGDLKLLVERVYLAFKAYRTGIHEFDKMESDSMRAIRAARNDSLQKAGWLINHYIILEKPILPVIVRGEKYVDNKAYYLDLNKVPADSVMSIEIMDTAYETTLHGLMSKGIVIRLKE